jgi:hypothetical protein
MNARIELFRECIGCKLVKPLDLAHWYHRDGRQMSYTNKCRDCTNTRKLESQARRRHHPEARRGRPPKMGNNCGECCGLPHRVVGPRCWACQLDYAPEPALDIRDYMFRTPDREIV